MAEHRVITYQGIRAPSPDGKQEDTVPWDDILGMDEQSRNVIFDRAQLSQDERTQLLDKLNKAHGEWQGKSSQKFSDWLSSPTKFSSWFGSVGQDTFWQKQGLNRLSDTLMSEYQGRQTKDKYAQESGIPTQPAAPAQQQQQGPQFSEANLQAYLKDFVQPILNERTNAEQSEWGNIAQQMGKYGGNKFPGFEGMKATATDMVRDSMISSMVGPYLQQANTAMGGAFNQGAGIAASAYSMQPIIQALASNPQVAAMFGQTSGGGNLLGGAGGGLGGLNLGGINSLFQQQPQQQQTRTP